MLDEEQAGDSLGQQPEGDAVPEADAPPPPAAHEESLIEELGALIDDAGLYATAELAFQKTRAKLIGKNAGAALLFVIVALILLHIALIAMAVGLVIALEPLVSIWGAIAIVVGLMLLGVGLLVHSAMKRGKIIAEMFAADTKNNDAQGDGS